MCECIDKLNAELEKHNTELTIPLLFNHKVQTLSSIRVCIATQKIDTKQRGKAFTVLAAYCPVCGTKYEDGG